MIAQLHGKVAAIGANWLVIDVAGVGFQVSTTPNTTSALRTGQTATVFTSLVVREDAMKLYGFGGTDERDCFELCRTASGVGPKLALAIVSVLTPEEFATAVRTEDLPRLCTVPGIGRKGAQKIVIELKDRVDALFVAPPNGSASVAPVTPAWQEQVMAGLESLGWSSRDAEAACETVAPLAEEDPEATVAALMKAALASLARV
ncbi:Holliday junction ATP-dependent DNA helicase [Propionibacterium freudenreichii]|uniref:Holliday junction branch migration protein RuvA n=1 Tax=Propionibacterium freudenreichii TaxID=1744 RepID=UPI000541D808|nr:Holliday junction branch migration protein RuvA [Propionibacterium freudenreichii]MDK9644162.1 Holliday junction branch migration protein RuvA [Propionibacterium freudenreichii]CEG86895.1 Holliday junction ATP-dependent DNA helicase [Propionibacterium freudenreichii]CEH04556.1 Holliday junction ATP-dependent DNA helicase [Propionibacterium freudenreichii]CEI26265.1 Holliday junction ATP-dependent DNA helicase [Propionibacterium freudenreichii]